MKGCTIENKEVVSDINNGGGLESAFAVISTSILGVNDIHSILMNSLLTLPLYMLMDGVLYKTFVKNWPSEFRLSLMSYCILV